MCSESKSNDWIISLLSGTANSAASDGVEALKSDTKSRIVKSVSCPIADITGISNLKMILANSSLLKQFKSSKEPPPLAIIIISILFDLLYFTYLCIALIILLCASIPCTEVGLTIKSTFPDLLLEILAISLITAPSKEVTIPILNGNAGIFFL